MLELVLIAAILVLRSHVLSGLVFNHENTVQALELLLFILCHCKDLFKHESWHFDGVCLVLRYSLFSELKFVKI